MAKATSNKETLMDLLPTTISKAKALCELFISCKRPVMLWGPIGVGKSDLIQQIATEQNKKVIDIRLSQMESVDLRGIPFFNQKENHMQWSPPCMFPKDPSDNSILFFDEINCAPPSIQASAYQLILNRRIGEYVLPENVTIVAAGNRIQDNGTTFKMPSPLLNRFVHIEIKYDFSSWEEWAKSSGISFEILEYLKENKKNLFSYDEKITQRAFATPRSWSFADQLFKKIMESDVKDKRKALKESLSSCIGATIAEDFVSQMKFQILRGLPKTLDIVEGKVKESFHAEYYPIIIRNILSLLEEMHSPPSQSFNQTTIQKAAMYVENTTIFLKEKGVPIEFLVTFLTEIKKASYVIDYTYTKHYAEEVLRIKESGVRPEESMGSSQRDAKV